MVSPFHTGGSGASIISSMNGLIGFASSVRSRSFREVWWVWGPSVMALDWLVVGCGVRDCSSLSGLSIRLSKFSFCLFSKSISSSCRRQSPSCFRWSMILFWRSSSICTWKVWIRSFALPLSSHGWCCSLLTLLLFVICCWKLCCLGPTVGTNCTCEDCEGSRQYLCLLVSDWCICILSSISFLYCYRSVGWGGTCDCTPTFKSVFCFKCVIVGSKKRTFLLCLAPPLYECHSSFFAIVGDILLDSFNANDSYWWHFIATSDNRYLFNASGNC